MKYEFLSLKYYNKYCIITNKVYTFTVFLNTDYHANTCNILVGKPEGKRLHGKPRRRWEDRIRIDLRDIG
jgi:hypothetical protein